MIENSFIFLERIGARLEQGIWRQGIRCWDDFFQASSINGVSKHRKPYYERRLREAQSALHSFDSCYFLDKLPKKEMWRLYPSFSDEAVFLDIETAGLEPDSAVTVIGLFDGINTKTMIKGINLDTKVLKQELQRYKLLITFNGASFDLPFLRKQFPGLIPKMPHIDLRMLCQQVGWRGGLKEIEKRFNIARNQIIERFYGGDPLRLWKMFRATGDDYYLKLLVEYNDEDVVNLQTIANRVTRRLAEQIKQKYVKNSDARDVENPEFS